MCAIVQTTLDDCKVPSAWSQHALCLHRNARTTATSECRPLLTQLGMPRQSLSAYRTAG